MTPRCRSPREGMAVPVRLLVVVRRHPEPSGAVPGDYWVTATFTRQRSAGHHPHPGMRTGPPLDTSLNADFCAARGIPVEEPPDGDAQAG